MKRYLPFALLTAVLAASAGCQSVHYAKTSPDGTMTKFDAQSMFSNTLTKGLTVEGTTKTTSQGLRITSNATEPNNESITASGAALGELIGTAAKATVKP